MYDLNKRWVHVYDRRWLQTKGEKGEKDLFQSEKLSVFCDAGLWEI